MTGAAISGAVQGTEAIITAQQLEMLGRALFGPTWQSDLARKLKINLRSMQRYAKGERVLPAEINVKLADVLEQRAAWLQVLAEDLRKKKGNT